MFCNIQDVYPNQSPRLLVQDVAVVISKYKNYMFKENISQVIKCSFFLLLLFNKVSGSKIWQMERSCMCCQESGEREASVSLFCPKAKQGEKKFRKVYNLKQFLCLHKMYKTEYKTK